MIYMHLKRTPRAPPAVSPVSSHRQHWAANVLSLQPATRPANISWSRWAAALFTVALLALGLVRSHAPAVLTGFAWATGDEADSRLIVFLFESNWRALLAGASPLSPPMFYPQPGTLGYADAHILWTPIYGAGRLLGLDPLRAFSAVCIVLLAFGYATFYWLLRRALGIGAAATSVGAFMFAFANAMSLSLEHGQMLGVMMLPSLLLLLHHAWRCQLRWPAVAAGLLTGLLAATSYMMAWFFLLFLGIGSLIGLLLFPQLCHGTGKSQSLRLLAWYTTGLAVGLVPFALIYGQQILIGTKRAYAETNAYRPHFSDLLNLGNFSNLLRPGNEHAVYGPFLDAIGVPGPPGDGLVERCFGSSPPVWILAIAGGIVLWRRRDATVPEQALLLAAAAAIAVTLLEFRYSRHVWPWLLVMKFVPGANAIRTPFRSEIVALLPISALLALALDTVLRRRSATGPDRVLTVATFVVLGAAAMAESRWTVAPYRLSAERQVRLLADSPAPPGGCTTFALAPRAGSDPPWQAHQNDALMLALHWHIPTIDGYSAWSPPYWELEDTGSPDYAAGMARWIARYHLRQGFCVYATAQRRWLSDAEVDHLLN
jgi:hypothetical protein